MADGIEVPVQVKIHVQEIVKVEFEIQNNVQSIRQCQGPLSLLNDLNLKVKQKINSLRQKVEVSKNYFIRTTREFLYIYLAKLECYTLDLNSDAVFEILTLDNNWFPIPKKK